MQQNELVPYWERMNHANERLVVMREQLVEFIEELTAQGDPAHLDIDRDGGVYYIKARG